MNEGYTERLDRIERKLDLVTQHAVGADTKADFIATDISKMKIDNRASLEAIHENKVAISLLPKEKDIFFVMIIASALGFGAVMLITFGVAQ
ncbi:hypothetical protein [Yoonia sp. 208BN28-4]|uniref:hypothetical protein n=1 Tax=Yoonia sp. 208BN28-4 TaxID=3126505 RepID=UPI0030B1E606